MHFYRKDIDGLRAISVYSVILFHLNVDFLSDLRISGGFIGVDIFFVISGFLISSIILSDLDSNKFSLIDFYNRRARRILPIFLIICIVSSFFAYFFFIPGELLEFSQSLLSSLFFSSNFFFWQNTGYFFSENELKPLIHTWSLAVEEQFYIFFPLLILISLRFFKKITVPLIILCFFLSLTLAEIESSDGSAGSFYLLPTRAWELISGILCAFYLRSKKVDISSKLKDFISTFGLILILSSLLIFREKFVHPGLITLMPVIGTVIIIIFYNKESFIYKFLSHKFFAFNGLISYSLYMWHQPVITFLSYNDKLNDNSEKFLAFLLILFLSIFSWKVIETPFRNTKIISNRRFYTILLTVFSSLCLVSIYGISSQGLLKNYPKNVHNLLLNDNQYGKYVWEKSQSYEGRNFNNVEKKNILIIGDSSSQDFLNSLVESNFLEKIEVSWLGINHECKKQNLDLKCLEYNLRSKKLFNELVNKSNQIFLSMAWSGENYENLKKILSDKAFTQFSSKLVVIGPKEFKLINGKRWKRNDFINLSNTERLKLKTKINEGFIDINQRMKKYFGEKKYIDLIEMFCDLEFKCSLFNQNNQIISYDGGHLTKEGAISLGKKLKENDIIRKSFY